MWGVVKNAQWILRGRVEIDEAANHKVQFNGESKWGRSQLPKMYACQLANLLYAANRLPFSFLHTKSAEHFSLKTNPTWTSIITLFWTIALYFYSFKTN